MNLATRRGVLAFVALSDAPMPNSIDFPERGGQNDGLLTLGFDSLADMHLWITDVFVLVGTRVSTQPYNHGGLRGTLGTATNLTWQGWSLYLSATDLTSGDEGLDDETRERLESVAADESEQPGGAL